MKQKTNKLAQFKQWILSIVSARTTFNFKVVDEKDADVIMTIGDMKFHIVKTGLTTKYWWEFWK